MGEEEKRRRCYKVIYSDLYTVVDMFIVLYYYYFIVKDYKKCYYFLVAKYSLISGSEMHKLNIFTE
jgi:hypothetical protein